MPWITLNENFKVTGFFSTKELAGQDADAVEITEEIRQELRDAWPYKGFKDGVIINLTESDVLTFQQCRDNKFAEINLKYNSAISSLFDNTPQSEIQSWTKQETEARAWRLDNDTPTPFIDAIVFGRQIDKGVLVERIIAKADVYSVMLGNIMGQRQAFEDKLNSATNSKDIEEILVEYKN